MDNTHAIEAKERKIARTLADVRCQILTLKERATLRKLARVRRQIAAKRAVSV